jgi:hypothetical protein
MHDVWEWGRGALEDAAQQTLDEAQLIHGANQGGDGVYEEHGMRMPSLRAVRQGLVQMARELGDGHRAGLPSDHGDVMEVGKDVQVLGGAGCTVQGGIVMLRLLLARHPPA